MSSWSLSNFSAKKFYSQGAYGSAALVALARACRATLPQQCAFCLAPCGHLLVCTACCESLQKIDSACLQCALPASDGARCGACLARPPPFAAAFAAFAYAFPLDRLLQAFKYGGRLSHADFFAAGLYARVAQRPAGMPWPDALVALPLAPSRQRERGFDQAAEIARRGHDGIYVEHGLVVHAGVITRRLRAITAIFRATAGLDRNQCRQLHGVGRVVRAMHFLRTEEKVVERQLEQRGDRIEAPPRWRTGIRCAGGRQADRGGFTH